MKRFLRFLLAAWCVAGLSASTRAAGRSDSAPPPEPRAGSRAAAAPEGGRPAGQDLARDWERVKALIRQGAYQEALASLDRLSAATPDDPRIQLYRALCQARAESPPPFPPVTRDQLTSLNKRLEQEAHAQRRAEAQMKALERAVKKEQERWDRELETLAQEAKREEARRRKEAQAEALARTRAERAKALQLARPPALPPAPQEHPAPTVAGQAPLPAEPSAPGEPGAPPQAPPGEAVSAPAPLVPHAPLPPIGPPRRGIELAPVTVPTAPAAGEPAAERPRSVARALPPPGTVQINADQMNVSPERKLAVAEGNVEVVFEGAVLTSDRLTLFTDTKDAYAEGRVRLEDGGQVFSGEMVHYNLETKKGRFLQGDVASPPWYEHGRSVEHLAEGILQVTPGYVTSCDHDPPHFKFYGSRAIVFADDRLVRVRNATFVVEQLPIIYLPWISVADRQSPFFFMPGKRKPWEQFALMGYRYEWPQGQKGALRLDWRRAFGWATGVDHHINDPAIGKGLLKLYYNEERYLRAPEDALPKGASINRYRVLWRHAWQPQEDTSVVTDIQEFSDVNFRKDFLFTEEYIEDDRPPDSFISLVKSTPAFSLTGLVRKRMNRFQTVTEAFPDLTVDIRQQQIGDAPFFIESKANLSSFQTKRAHSEDDTDAIRADWFQQLSYAMSWFRPVEVTHKVGMRQTYHTKDIQGGAERPQGNRDVVSGQGSYGVDASLKFFRIFPFTSTLWGLNINRLRHVLTPTVGYLYTHRPTIPNDLFSFGAAIDPKNHIAFGLENKLQTKRPTASGSSTDLARFLISTAYTFRGNHNKAGGRLSDWGFDLELFPWPWLRLESDWSYPAHFTKGSRDEPITTWNLDLSVVGGDKPRAQDAPAIQPSTPPGASLDPQAVTELLMPVGHWSLGLSHRYSYDDKTEDVVQFDWRPSEKWEISTSHRFTWKEVAGEAKRFNNMRRYQYVLRRDLHDWLAELLYRVDREFGEEVYFVMRLKAYPNLPFEVEESYHQPKYGSQSSPFSPIRGQ